ncbi:hypothetical protein MMC19_006875 [Ptychographa xylographoides]|nr:hypothetical protein [Ptychographa xylographoides]
MIALLHARGASPISSVLAVAASTATSSKDHGPPPTAPSAPPEAPAQSQINLTATDWPFRHTVLPRRADPPNRIARRSIFRTTRENRKYPPINLWNPINTSSNAYNVPKREGTSEASELDRSRNRNLSESNSIYPLLPLPPQNHNFNSYNSLVVERSEPATPTTPRLSIGLPASARPIPPPDPKGKGKEKGKQAVYNPPVRGARQFSHPESSSRPLPPLPLTTMNATKHLDDPTLSHDSLPLSPMPPPSLPAKDTPPPSRGPNPSYPHSPSPSEPQDFSNEAFRSLRANDNDLERGGTGANSPAPSLPWTHLHPCYPHPNPHVPLSSPLYSSTRIIRIPRDWMLAGDLAPTFSNTYPEILAPWVPEQDFRELVEKINSGLIRAMDPWGVRNLIDGIVGALTGWLWEDAGLAWGRRKVGHVEEEVRMWNLKRERQGRKGEEGNGEDGLVRVVELRKTAFMSLDFQIPDPKIGSLPPSAEQPLPIPEPSRPQTDETGRQAERFD